MRADFGNRIASIVSSSVKVVCQTSPGTAFKCRNNAKYLPVGADGLSVAPLGLTELPDVLIGRSADRSSRVLAGAGEPGYAAIWCLFLGPECLQLLVIEALHFIERPFGPEGFEQLTQGRKVMKSQVRRQGSRVVGDFVARVLCGKRQGPNTPGKGSSPKRSMNTCRRRCRSKS